MNPGHAFCLYMGQVLSVRMGEGQTGGTAPQWLVQVRLTTGAEVDNCRVVGGDAPLEDGARPSWGIVGYIAGNVDDPIFWPMATAETRPDDWKVHHGYHEWPRVALHVHESGQIVIRGRDPDESIAESEDLDNGGAADWRMRIQQGLVEMLGGGYRMARGATADELPGDKLAINEATSPQAAAWFAAVTAAINQVVGPMATAMAAMQAQIAALEAWGATVQHPPLPALPAAPAAPGAPVALAVPNDPVPAFEGQGVQPGAGFQIAGELRTGSAGVTGR